MNAVKTDRLPDDVASVLPPPHDRGAISLTISEDACLVASDLSVRLPQSDRCILKQVSLSLRAGEHVGIMGLSGAGKTTLLHALAGRIAPESGSIRHQGKIATIYQDLRLISSSRVLDQVLHGGLGESSPWAPILGYSSDLVERAQGLVSRVGLSFRAHHRVSRLSGGERQRVAVARALMSEPSVLLADEPVSSLDEAHAREMLDLLSELSKERGLAIVSVLHDGWLAHQYCDRVFELRDGRLVETPINAGFPTGGRSKLTILNGGAAGAPAVCPMTGAACPQPLREWRKKLFLSTALFAAILWALVSVPVSDRSIHGMGDRFISFLLQLIPSRFAEISELPWRVLYDSLLETIKIALLGTFFGAILSLPLATVAAGRSVPQGVRATTRMILNAMRAVPSLLWALLCTAVVGFGPLAGVVALSVYSIGYLAKFFYETLETLDQKPVDALRELGAGRLQRFLAGSWPLAKVQIFSSIFFVFEYNIRAASVLGVVDAGGIGFYLKQFIEYRQFPAVLATLALTVAVVLLIDYCSQQVRRRYVKRI